PFWLKGHARTFADQKVGSISALLVAMRASAAAAFDDEEHVKDGQAALAAAVGTRGRPPGQPRSRPASAGSAPRPNYYSYDAFLGRGGGGGGGSRPSSAGRQRAWGVARSVLRSFDEVHAKVPPEEMDLKWGPREGEYRQIGARLLVEAQEKQKEEVERSRDGKVRRAAAEDVLRQHRHHSSGQPWRAARHGGRRSAPRHLPGCRFNGGPGPLSNGSGLFSECSSVEAGEHALRLQAQDHVEGESSEASWQEGSEPAGGQAQAKVRARSRGRPPRPASAVPSLGRRAAR
ncbi:unnamed protein product, partial [Polarella glacialis]